MLELIWKKSKETKKPIYFIIDDTISEKTKPSSKAINHIKQCGFHNSHLKGTTVYGHQILVSLLSSDGLVLPYSIDIYDKNSMSKIELAKNLVKSLPKPENKGYVLGDSWYSCKTLFTASRSAGYAYIGALKTNRVIYPENHNNFDLVTVKNQEYYIYNYVGNLKDIKTFQLLLAIIKNHFRKMEH